MVKGKWHKFLIAAGVALSLVIFTVLFFPVICFPLSLAVSGHVFHVGDKISGTATITNKSGIDVNVVYSEPYTPCTYFHNIRDMNTYIYMPIANVDGVMKAGDKWSHDFMYEITELGIYLVDAHSPYFRVNNYPNYHPIFNRCYDIVIVLA